MLLLFKDGKERCVNDVINELKPEYNGFKMLKFPAVQEGLMTAQQNGLLDETRFDLDEEGKLTLESEKIVDVTRKKVEEVID